MRKVLVVDDEMAITEGLVALFELEEIPAMGAVDRESAEKLIEQQFYPIILADLRLKTEADGYRLLESIRRLSPESKVASLTAFATPEVEARLLELGSSMVLRKPMEFDEIVAIVREMLEAIEQQAAAQNPAEPLDLDRLYDDVQRVLYAIPQRRFGFTPDETEELVQEAWCLFLQKQQGIRAPRPWLAGTIVNLCKQQIHTITRSRETTRELGEEISVSRGDYFAAKDAQMMLGEAMEKIDERSRKLCTLIGLQGLSYEEVASQLELPIGSVGPLFIRAKAKVRKAMAQWN